MRAPGSARSALAYAITRPGLHRIYPDASKLVGYAGQPDGSLDEITSAAIPDQIFRKLGVTSRAQLAQTFQEPPETPASAD